MKTIYYLDDDWRYAKAVISNLNSRALESRITWDLRRIPSESAFLQTIENIKSRELPLPSAFILDVMVRYANPKIEDQVEDALTPPYDRAGIRCAELVRINFPDVPLILFTILDEEDLPPETRGIGVQYVAKEPNIAPLFRLLCKALV